MNTSDRLDRNNLLQVIAVLVLAAATAHAAHAATLASATFDTDSYIFIGTNNEFEAGISTFTDYSGGVLDALNNGHFNFAVIKFDDLSGIQTVASGGHWFVPSWQPGTCPEWTCGPIPRRYNLGCARWDRRFSRVRA